MINVDGVICGNFRTSLSGRDLNRMYGINKYTWIVPEVESIINYIKRSNVIGIIDLHGHSSRLNSFIYGGGIVDYQNIGIK